MREWRTVRLEELAVTEKSAISKPYGSAILKADYLPFGVPVVRGVNVARGVFHDDDFVFISSGLVSRMPGATLASGDLVFTHRGTVGQVSMIPRSPRFERYVLSTSHVKVRLDQELALPEFYCYWFRSLCGQHTILENSSTVGVPGIAQPVATIKNLRVPCPPLREQRAIADVLGALDDKIAVNDRILTGLSGLSCAWFDASLEAGNRLTRVDELAEFHNRRRVPLSSRERAARPGDVPYYGAAGRLDFVDAPIFSEPVVLVGEDGTVIREDGRPVVQYIWGPAWVNNHAHVLTGLTISTELLRVAIERANVSHLVTGAVQPKLSMGNLKSLLLAIPVDVSPLDDRLQEFAAAARAITEENRRLAGARDELSPLLMSGKVRVRDAERTVGEAI